MTYERNYMKTYTQADYDRDFAASGGEGVRNVGQSYYDPRPHRDANGQMWITLADGTKQAYNENAADQDAWKWGLAGMGLAALPVAAGVLGAGAVSGGEASMFGPETTYGNAIGGESSSLFGPETTYGNAPGIGNPLTSTPPGSGTALSRLLGLSPGQGDALDLAGKAGGTFLGLLGSDAQSKAYKDVAAQYLALGAGDRKRLDDSYKPGFDIWKQAGYGDLLSGVTDTQLRRLSANGGNPFGNPGGLAEMNKNITANVGIPALAGYRGQLLQGGGVGLSAAAQGSLMEAGTARSPYDALGAGLAAMTTPRDNSLQDLLKQYYQQQITLNRSGVT